MVEPGGVEVSELEQFAEEVLQQALLMGQQGEDSRIKAQSSGRSSSDWTYGKNFSDLPWDARQQLCRVPGEGFVALTWWDQEAEHSPNLTLVLEAYDLRDRTGIGSRHTMQRPTPEKYPAVMTPAGSPKISEIPFPETAGAPFADWDLDRFVVWTSNKLEQDARAAHPKKLPHLAGYTYVVADRAHRVDRNRTQSEGDWRSDRAGTIGQLHRRLEEDEHSAEELAFLGLWWTETDGRVVCEMGDAESEIAVRRVYSVRTKRSLSPVDLISHLFGVPDIEISLVDEHPLPDWPFGDGPP